MTAGSMMPPEIEAESVGIITDITRGLTLEIRKGLILEIGNAMIEKTTIVNCHSR